LLLVQRHQKKAATPIISRIVIILIFNTKMLHAIQFGYLMVVEIHVLLYGVPVQMKQIIVVNRQYATKAMEDPMHSVYQHRLYLHLLQALRQALHQALHQALEAALINQDHGKSGAQQRIGAHGSKKQEMNILLVDAQIESSTTIVL